MTADEATDQLITLLRQRQDVTPSAIGADDRLADLGVDSIDLAYVLSNFERTHDADFADADFDLERYVTVGDLAQAIRSRIDG